MAEETKKPEEAAVDVPSTDKTKSVVIILIALAVIVMIFTPIVTIFTVRTIISSNAPAPVAETKSVSKDGEIIISKFQCNVGHTRATRYLSMDIVIQFSEPTEMAKFFKDKKDDPNGMMNKIKAEILAIVKEKQLDELDSKNGLRNLSEEIKEAIKNCLPKDPKVAPGTVTDVFFSNFIIN